MGLRDVIQTVRGREKTLTVYTSPATDIVADLREYFASQNLVVERAAADGRPEHAVLSDDGEYLASVGVDALRALTDGGDPRAVGEHTPYGALLAELDRTTFTSYSDRQMLQATREIEDRAWRQDGGCLHAGFQKLSNFESEWDTYSLLAGGELDVHVYGVPDTDVSAPEGVTVHESSDPEIAATWFVMYDDAGGDQSSALLAEERDEDGFYGFWTYDAELVADALDALDALRCEV